MRPTCSGRTLRQDGKIRDETPASISRAARPASKLTTCAWGAGTMRGAGLDETIAKLAADTRPLQPSALNQADLAEFTHHDYPKARLAACRNPALAVERTANARPCCRLPKASRPPITASVLTGAHGIGLRAGQVVSKHTMARHFTITTTTTTSRNRPGTDAGAGPDGTCVIRTTVPADDLDTATVGTACKNQAHPERDLQAVKAAPAFSSFMAAVGHIQP